LQQALVMVNLKSTERQRGSQKSLADVGMQANIRYQQLRRSSKTLPFDYWLLNDAAVKFDFT
jgi:hypothetical protein